MAGNPGRTHTMFAGVDSMDNMTELTIGDLEERRSDALSRSEKAALRYPEIYRSLKWMLREINAAPLDVSQYYRTALGLAKLLETLTRAGRGTIFDHYLRNIDPAQAGDVRYFRFECMDLAEQLDCFERWSAERHHLRVVK